MWAAAVVAFIVVRIALYGYRGDLTASNGPGMTEAGGPLNPPTRRGFGTHVMDTMIRGQLKGEMRIDWHPEGLVCEIALPNSLEGCRQTLSTLQKQIVIAINCRSPKQPANKHHASRAR
jgi:hypothetical protein